MISYEKEMKRISEFAKNFRLEDVTSEVVIQAKRIILDTMGAILGGLAKEKINQELSHQAGMNFAGRGATVVGRHGRFEPTTAAFINGTASVALELDEGNAHAKGHPASHVIPAIFAVAEDQQVSGRRLLEAVIVAYEIATRAGEAAHLHDFVHPHGTHSVLGSALGVGMILGLSSDKLEQALYLASNFAVPSSQKAALVGATVRNMFTGVSNVNGIWSAYGARAGFTGEPDSANLVFANMLGRKFEGQILDEDLGSRYFILENYIKLHACSRWNHAPIDAAESLRESIIGRLDSLDRIHVYTYDPATRLSLQEVENPFAAKFSIPYNVAAMILYGTCGLEAYEAPIFNDSRVHDLAKKVYVLEDPELTRMIPDVRAARIEAAFGDGTKLQKFIERANGNFDNPYPDEVLQSKFMKLAKMSIPEEQASRMVEWTEKLDQLEDIGSYGELLGSKEKGEKE